MESGRFDVTRSLPTGDRVTYRLFDVETVDISGQQVRFNDSDPEIAPTRRLAIA